MTWPVILFWMLLAGGLASRSSLLVHLFFAAAPFGSLAVVPVEMAMGVNLLPQSVCAVFLILRLLQDPGERRRGFEILLDPRQLGILALFLGTSLVGAVFLPRIFAGLVDVVSLSGAVSGPQPLAASTANVTQPAYLSLSVGTIVAFTLLARRSELRATIHRALLTGGVTLAATGALALVAADQPGLLAPFRTVSYVLLTEDEALGARRLVGLMPEASAFGALCVVYGASLAFLQPLLDGRLRLVSAACILVLFVMALLSTSSTAYAGTALCGGLWGLNALRRSMSGIRRSAGPLPLLGLAAAPVVLLGVALLAPQVLESARQAIDTVLVQKVGSASYLERMQWNQTALLALLQTGGAGVGLGSARTSNWMVAVVSNTGVLGAALMLAFVVQTFLRTASMPDPATRDMMIGLKAVILVCIALGALAGTSADFGVGVGAIYGLVTGLALADAPVRAEAGFARGSISRA